MGKPTGFMEYGRSEAGHRPVQGRIKDYDEFTVPQGGEALNTQAARCMDCGVPFCHAGFVVQGLSIGCPLSNLVPEINDLVYRGEIELAYQRLSKTHPFPEFTARVCPALCEGSCTLGEHELPVTVKDIERFVIDEMMASGKVKPRYPKANTGKRVAVVGSGPSGLACADLLNQLGNSVTVFERADRPGGLLMYGIPNMKLSKQLVEGRASLLRDEGVKFQLGADVGNDYPVLALMRDFDAIVLCCGATAERRLTVPGSDLEGVVTAVSYLAASTKNVLDGTPMPSAYSADGKDVIVVGGGDTGTDCVATAIRRGAKSVAQFEIMARLPEERAANNPWPLWPRVFKTDYGQLEAIELFGRDPREFLTTVKEIEGDGRRVGSVTTVEVKWEDKGGRPVPVETPGSEKKRPAGLVLTAMGFTGPERTLIDQLNLKADARGNVAADEDEYRTSLPTVFACGDMRRGPSLVVWAIFEGVRAAKACDKYLRLRQNV
ncbi:MAG: glutamate synthase subunit beta [Clostridiales Family XIII bacterium]|jgi:glutamate synthase (NADPH/NADH) small chain|nr:glutamate synthase subunit beta [Clostridiales Family XIII bacterium]